jgi:hypothetical protein
MNISNWLKESNHNKHLIAGLIILTISLLLVYTLTKNDYATLIISNFVVAACMATAEYKDKLYGGKFDWEDILAGMIPSIIADILYLVILFIK